MPLRTAISAFVAFCLLAETSTAEVFHMGGTRNADGSWAGLASLETVRVGDPGNVGELSGRSIYAGHGTDRVCGAVSYEYRIGKYEVTAAQYCEFLNAVAGVDTYGLYNVNMWSSNVGTGQIERYAGEGTALNPYRYRAAMDWANRPIAWVSFWDACRFANWLHNGQPTGLQIAGVTETGAYTLNGFNGSDGRAIRRNADALWALPTEDEWYKAAYYKGGSTDAGYWDYPTRSDNLPSNVLGNPVDSGCNATFYGQYPNFYTGQYPYWTTDVGAHEKSASPYGAFDQGGNVEEWNETVVYQDSFSSQRGTRGGTFQSEEQFLRASYRLGFAPQFEYYLQGFRVVQIPEPAAFLMLGFALAGFVRSRPRQAG